MSDTIQDERKVTVNVSVNACSGIDALTPGSVIERFADRVRMVRFDVSIGDSRVETTIEIAAP
jgi:hypothetical protein